MNTFDRDEQPARQIPKDEVYSKRLPAGKRTYFFDVKSTQSGQDFYLTITESKQRGEGQYEKHRIFLYKEDFVKFADALEEVLAYVKENHLQDYDFHQYSNREKE